MHGGILKNKLAQNDHHDKIMCCKQEPSCLVIGRGQGLLLSIVHSFNEVCSCQNHNLVMHGGI